MKVNYSFFRFLFNVLEILKSRTRFKREEVLEFLDPQKKVELERVLRGFINRVAESNIESIFKQLVQTFSSDTIMYLG